MTRWDRNPASPGVRSHQVLVSIPMGFDPTESDGGFDPTESDGGFDPTESWGFDPTKSWGVDPNGFIVSNPTHGFRSLGFEPDYWVSIPRVSNPTPGFRTRLMGFDP